MHRLVFDLHFRQKLRSGKRLSVLVPSVLLPTARLHALPASLPWTDTVYQALAVEATRAAKRFSVSFGPFHASRVLRCPARLVPSQGKDGVASGLEAAPPTLQSLGKSLATLNLRKLWHSRVPQGDRFDKVDFLVFDTNKRHAIRVKLWALAESDLREAKESTSTDSQSHSQAYVTGVGGNGKSHNLALFVQQARDAGAVVLYIHDMQRWLSASTLFFDELTFAVAQWNLCHGAKGLLEVPAIVSEILAMQVPADRTTANTVGVASQLLRARCTALGVPFIIVIDQDNRLNKLQNENMPVTFEQYNRMIEVMNPHLLVLGASANNEGWDRRGWPNRIEHLPEAVPEACIATLFPLTQADAAVRAMLAEDFGNYPMMLGIAQRTLDGGDELRQKAVRDVPAGTEAKAVRDELNLWVYTKVKNYLDNGKFASNAFRRERYRSAHFILDRDRRVENPVQLDYDRNLTFIDGKGEGRRLKSIFRHAEDQLREHTARILEMSPVRAFGLDSSPLGDGDKYELFFRHAVCVLLRPVGRKCVGNSVVRLPKASLQPSDLQAFMCDTSSNDVLQVFENTPGGQIFDFVAVRKLWNESSHRWTYFITFFQLTTNVKHVDSRYECESTPQAYLGKSTTLDACLQAVHDAATAYEDAWHQTNTAPSQIVADFVYIGPTSALELTSRTNRSVKEAVKDWPTVAPDDATGMGKGLINLLNGGAAKEMKQRPKGTQPSRFPHVWHALVELKELYRRALELEGASESEGKSMRESNPLNKE